MNQTQRLDALLERLGAEHGGLDLPPDEAGKRRLLRALMNVRPPAPLEAAVWDLQDAYLQEEARIRGVVTAESLPAVPGQPRLCLWQGDITRLAVDAIVNAANSALLGCFYPNHGCIDNAIHSAAGLQLRAACQELMQAQGYEEPVGRAKVTPGFNLPCRYVIHTVGPRVTGRLTPRHCQQLQACYEACLKAAADAGCHSLALCCLSTGEFHFPPDRAAAIAVGTVRAALPRYPLLEKVIFNVYHSSDLRLYKRLLGCP